MTRKRYLANTLIQTLLILIIGIFLSSQAIMVYSNYQDEKRQLDNHVRLSALALRSPLSEALWDYDQDQIDAIGESLYLNEEVVGILISDEVTGTRFSKSRNNPGGKLKSLELIINYENETIGLLTINYTNHYFLQEMTTDFLIQSAVVIVILMITFYYIYKFTQRVSKPISLLANTVGHLTERMEEPIAIETESYEVDILISAFEAMRLDVLNYTKELRELNESLEKRVEKRTKELEEKNHELEATIERLKDAEVELMRISRIELTQQLVSGVAHELNTPLGNAITLNSFLKSNFNHLVEAHRLNEKDEKSIKSFNQSFETMEMTLLDVSALIEHFKALDFRSNLSVEKEVNLLELLSSRSIIQPLNGQCQLQLDIEIDKALTLVTKPFILMEVVKQLLENACLHAYESEEVAVVKLYCEQTPHRVNIIVEDFGKGMTDSQSQEVFKPFSKSNLSTVGVGLGLSIVENLVVDGLDGTIRCISKEHVGTRFVISLRRV